MKQANTQPGTQRLLVHASDSKYTLSNFPESGVKNIKK